MVANIADVLNASAQERPATVAIVDGDRKATYAGLDESVSAFAAGLIDKGLKPGDRVAMLQGNTLDFVIAFFAIVRAGGVAVPLNSGLTAGEVAQAVRTTAPRLLVVDLSLASGLDLDSLKCRVIMPGSRDWDQLTHGHEETPAVGGDEDLAVLLFTTGTAGAPRPAMLTHRALLANVSAMLNLDAPAVAMPGDTSLGVLPLFHVYSLNAVLVLGMAAGVTIVLSDRFDAHETLELIQRHGVTIVAGAPPMYVALSGEDGLRQSLESVRLLLSGASPLAPALFEQFRTVTGKPIWEGYGLTECSPVVTTTLVSGRAKAGSVGQPLPNVQIKIVPERVEEPGLTIDGLDDAEESEPGEIWVRAPSLFSGYWPDGEDGPDAEGWFGTGDVGYLDADGDLVLVDRRSELIIVSGFNVYPREVERVIEQHPSVLECAVVGVEHPYSGEAVKAFVVLAPDRELDTDELIHYCETRLARFKCPTIVAFVDRLPHGATGKVDKAGLRS